MPAVPMSGSLGSCQKDAADVWEANVLIKKWFLLSHVENEKNILCFILFMLDQNELVFFTRCLTKERKCQIHNKMNGSQSLKFLSFKSCVLQISVSFIRIENVSLTVLLGINVDKSQKLIPLVIWKYLNPQCMKNCKFLHVIYDTN